MLLIRTNYFISETIFDIAQLREKVRQREVEINQDSFWTENPDANTLFSELSKLKKTVDSFDDVVSQSEDINAAFELLESGEDEELLEECQTQLKSFVFKIDQLEERALLSGPYDNHAAIFTLVAGAGGTDAQDWTQIMFRMYTRWFEKKKFKVQVTEESFGDEAGMKSATMIVEGEFAYGLLKQEVGIHRMVRLSPFNSNNKRQTNFAAVDVIPKLDKDFSDITIDPQDLRVDTFRASGSGGQHVNKTDSAVRLTHIPTGCVASSQTSRSQGENKDVAMSLLKSKLLKLMQDEHKEHVSEIRGESKEVAWGNQIRSYVFHPYKLVKDLRTGVETSDVQDVIDGNLDVFVNASLRNKA
ncbi:peptide chain release factor 2 [Candidatus Marinamargulisbacteria bacterium SCGC AAA071-K20]|nr:peptide chain release factor 2 [Candidatus Marinamargulisbacteria bacterium SCGC AAA071-K20]